MKLSILIAAALLAGLAYAQSAAPAFEAVSIKPTAMTGNGASIDRRPGVMALKNATLQDCIREAYGLTDSQISGDKWLAPDRYDIVAKMPSGASQDQRPAMLQAMLAERFKLESHRGSREMQVYLLVVSKSGNKLQAVDGRNGGITFPRAGYLSATAAGMASFATVLSGSKAQLGHPVIDRTGLGGAFTFTLEWTPEDKTDTLGPSLFTALQEQLGLKLETGKAPVDILIVDHAEKPSEN